MAADSVNKETMIRNAILSMIRRGVVSPGDKLPSIRTLSRQYKTSVTPVINAYSSLVAERIVESRPHSGYYVSTETDDPHVRERSQNLRLNASDRYSLFDTFMPRYSNVAFNVNNDIDESFGTTSASPLLYARELFDNCFADAMRETKLQENGQPFLHDLADLKKALMKWIAPCEFSCVVEDISVVRSVTDGTILALRACAEPGSEIAVEVPGHTGFFFLARYFNYRVIPVPGDPVTGLDVDAFSSMLEHGVRPACLLLCSTFSNPTGATMPDEAKIRLVRLCSSYNIPIIEDDIQGEISFADHRPLPLKSFDNDNVIYLSGFGKCLYPPTRTGFILGGRYKDAISFYKHLAVSYAPGYLQTAMASFLLSGKAENYVGFFRKQIKKIMDSYRDLMLEYFPKGTRVSEPKGGIYLWVTLPDGMDADSLSTLASSHGISISPSRLFNAPAGMESSFRFNCAAVPWDDSARDAVKRLGGLARRLAHG